MLDQALQGISNDVEHRNHLLSRNKLLSLLPARPEHVASALAFNILHWTALMRSGLVSKHIVHLFACLPACPSRC